MTLSKHRKILYIIVLLLTINGCDSIENIDLLGKWNVEKASLTVLSLTENQVKDLQNELESMVFYFKEDGLLLYSNYYRSGAHGQWILIPEENKLTCTYQYERATYSDKFMVFKEGQLLKLTSTDFEGVSETKLHLVRSTH